MNSGEVATRLGLPGVHKAAETIVLERDVRLVEITGGRYHAAPAHVRREPGRGARRQGAQAAGDLRRLRSTTSRSTRTTSAPTAPSSA